MTSEQNTRTGSANLNEKVVKKEKLRKSSTHTEEKVKLATGLGTYWVSP